MTPEAFASEVSLAFDRAVAETGLTTSEHSLAGHPFRLSFAGPLGPLLTPAFAHLPRVYGAGLEIRVWDRAGTGIPAPRPPWGIDDYLTKERIQGFDDVRYDVGNGLLTVDTPSVGLFHALDHARVPRWVVRMPFRHLIGSWATRHDLALVHAAAVGVDGACVLLPGTSGSGKSTTALTAAAFGLDFLADDLCLIDPSGLTAHAPYALAKLERDAFDRLPQLRSAVLSEEEGQSLISPPGLRTSARLVAIAVPRVTDAEKTKWTPSTSGEALRAAGPSTLIEGNGGGPSTLALLRDLVESLPCFDLALGSDPGHVAESLAELVSACR